jgi:hypothetical protein
MGATPAELKREIDRTRDELRADVGVVADRLAPKNVARPGAERARESLREPKARAAVATAVGLLLLRRRRARGRATRAASAAR